MVYLNLLFLTTHAELFSQSQQLLIDDFQVNEKVGWCPHFDPQIAVHKNGSFIIVWHDYRNTHADIYLQRFDNNCNHIGDAILVNDDAGFNKQIKPDIDIADNGQFVVTWIDDRSGTSEIYAQRFDSLANRLGNNFPVNEAKGNFSEYSNPSIALSCDGHFIITWLEQQEEKFGVYAKLYNPAGEQLTAMFKVNDQDNAIDQYVTPDVGMDDDGNAVIVWEDVRKNPHRDIFAQRFDLTANRLGENFQINDDENDRFHGNPTVSVFPGGNFIITWIDERNYFYDIYAARYDCNGVPIGSNFMVNDFVNDGQQFTPVVCTSSSGRFVISWKDGREAHSILYDIFAQIYDQNGTPVGSNIKIQDDENSMYYLTPPSSDMDSSGNFIIAWNDRHIGTNQIYAQKYDSLGTIIDSTFQVNTDAGSGHQLNPDITAANGDHFSIVWEDFRNGNADIYFQGFSSTAIPVGGNFRVNTDSGKSEQSAPRIGIDSLGNALVVWQDNREGINQVYGQRCDANYQPVGDNFRINENNPQNGAWFPKIAMNQAGSCIIAWLESAWADMNIYAQRYDSKGNKLDRNFKVNDDEGHIVGFDFLYEHGLAVGMDDIGHFIISWTEYRDNKYGILFKIYDSNANPINTIDRVPIKNSGFVYNYSICMGPNGSFVICWFDGPNIYAQLFDSSGVPVGSNVLVNDIPGTDVVDLSPTLSMNEHGIFCIAWQDNRNGDADIYCQIYAADGQPIYTNFKINSNTDISNQQNPSLYLKSSLLFTAWEDNRIPGQGWDIFTNVISLEKLTGLADFYSGSLPVNYCLYQNYPNPFNPSTNIEFEVPDNSFISLKVYNLLGEEVAELAAKDYSAGVHSVTFDASQLASGIYFYTLRAKDSNFEGTRKMVVMK